MSSSSDECESIASVIRQADRILDQDDDYRAQVFIYFILFIYLFIYLIQ